MKIDNSYNDYLRAEWKLFSEDQRRRLMLVSNVEKAQVTRVLDVGCGAGQEMLSFVEEKKATGFGVDIAVEVGQVGRELFAEKHLSERVFFLRSSGENLPFSDETFDVVICRVVLPYMNNRQALSEIARVMRPQGLFFLKIHAPSFYFSNIFRAIKTKNLKSIFYQTVCLIGGTYYFLSGKHPNKGIFKGKEVYQTENSLKRELSRNQLEILKYLPDNNKQTPSFVIVKK